MASHAEGSHLRVLVKLCVNLSIHTASDVRLPTLKNRQWGKSVGLARRTRASQSLAPLGPPAQALELPTRPADQVGLDTQQRRSQLFSTEVAEVVDPAADIRIVLIRQIVQGFVAVVMKPSPPDRPADGLQRSWTGGRPEGVSVETTMPDRLPGS